MLYIIKLDYIISLLELLDILDRHTAVSGNLATGKNVLDGLLAETF